MNAIPSLFLTIALLSLPLDPGGWRELTFDGVPSNRVEFGDDSLTITVEESASPLVRLHEGPPRIRRVIVSGRVEGSLRVEPGELPDRGFEDALLRVGAITRGEKRLNVLQRRLAPGWLRRLDELLGDRTGGIGEIPCALLVPHAEWVGESKRNPRVDLFHDRMAAAPDEDGAFRMVLELEDAPAVRGLWLQADGDDTGSSFRVRVDEIEIEAAE